MATNRATARVVVEGRCMFANVYRPIAQYNGEPQYTLTLAVDKDDEDSINAINGAIEYVKDQSMQMWGGRIPNNLRLPIHDGDEEKPDNPAFTNRLYINAKSKEPPQIVDRNVQPILDQTEFYSGCYANVSLVFYSYNFGGAKGIAVWLGNIQKIRDGDPFSSRKTAKDDFKIVSVGEIADAS